MECDDLIKLSHSNAASESPNWRPSSAAFGPKVLMAMLRGSMGVLAAVAAAGFALMVGIFAAAGEERPAQASACGGAIITRGTVAHVLDGRSFVLADGREVRLAGIEVPPLPLPGHTDPAAGGGEAARQDLTKRVAGAEILLRQAEPQPGRPLRTACRLWLPRRSRWRKSAAIRASGRRFCPRRHPRRRPRLHDGTIEPRNERPPGKAWPLGRSVL